MNKFVNLSGLFILFSLSNYAWCQSAGTPSININGSIALFTVSGATGLGTTGEVLNTNNTLCYVKNIEVQWGRVDTNNNNAFTPYSSLFYSTKFTVTPTVVTPNSKWTFTTGNSNTLFNNSQFSLGANEKYASKVTANYSFYIPNQPLPQNGVFSTVIIKP